MKHVFYAYLLIAIFASLASAADSVYWKDSGKEIVIFGIDASGNKQPVKVDASGSAATTGGGGVGTDAAPNVSRPVNTSTAVHSAVTVSTSSTLLLASGTRKSCSLQADPANTGNVVISLGATASPTTGIVIPAGATVSCVDQATVYQGAISAIVTAGTGIVRVIELN